MKKILVLGPLAVLAIAVPATAASALDAAAPAACPAGTDSVQVPYAWSGETPLLAGTVCVRTGGTTFSSMVLSPGWSGEVKSDGSKGRTEVRFSNRSTGAKLDLRYEPGRTEIR